MLTGNEKIKDVENNDICNWLGNSLSSVGAKQVRIETENNHLGRYRVLYVDFKDYNTRLAFIGDRIANTTVQEIKNLILFAVEHQQKNFKKQCRYKFQDKDKFDGKPYCSFFIEQCSNIDFICDENCEVFEQNKRIDRLENELKITHTQYKQVVKQNKNLQSDLRRYTSAIDKIEEFTESVYEHIPEDKVLRKILNIINDVKYKGVTNE